MHAMDSDESNNTESSGAQSQPCAYQGTEERNFTDLWITEKCEKVQCKRVEI